MEYLPSASEAVPVIVPWTTTEASISSLKSGKLSLTVNGIPALNNENNNDAKGDYSKAKPGIDDYDDEETYTTFSNFYNRKPNSENNYILTDDAVLDVWKITKEAGKPYAGGRVDELTMKISPSKEVWGKDDTLKHSSRNMEGIITIFKK